MLRYTQRIVNLLNMRAAIAKQSYAILYIKKNSKIIIYPVIQYTSVLPRHKSDKSRNGWRVRLHIDKESALEQTSAEFALKTVGGLVTLFINPESTRGNIIPKGTYRFTGSSQQHHGAPPPNLRTCSSCITATVAQR